MFDAKAVGGRYYRVMVNGVEFSKHTQDYKASEQAGDIIAALVFGIWDGQTGEVPTVEVTEDNVVEYTIDDDFLPGGVAHLP